MVSITRNRFTLKNANKPNCIMYILCFKFTMSMAESGDYEERKTESQRYREMFSSIKNTNIDENGY